MSRPKPFLHFKSSISGSIRALKPSSSSSLAPFSSSFSAAHRFSANASRRASSSRHGTSPLARQSLRDKSQSRSAPGNAARQPQQQQKQKQEEAAAAAAEQQAVAGDQQQQEQQKKKNESAPATEESGGGTMVKMTASASRMAFTADGARHTKAMAARPGDPNNAEHLSRMAARARTATISVRRTQSAKSKRSVSRGSSGGSAHSAAAKKKGGSATAKLLEFGPLRFMAKESSSRVKLVRQDSQRQPGLRAMLYGLTLKMEREEKLQKKLLRKRARE